MPTEKSIHVIILPYRKLHLKTGKDNQVIHVSIKLEGRKEFCLTNSA